LSEWRVFLKYEKQNLMMEKRVFKAKSITGRKKQEKQRPQKQKLKNKSIVQLPVHRTETQREKPEKTKNQKTKIKKKNMNRV
jgi:hypothetical protein